MGVFDFLREFRRSFEKMTRQLSSTDRKSELTRMLADLISQYNNQQGSSKVQRMEQELENVTDIMRDNISKVMERGERIESLIDKTTALNSESFLSVLMPSSTMTSSGGKINEVV